MFKKLSLSQWTGYLYVLLLLAPSSVALEGNLHFDGPPKVVPLQKLPLQRLKKRKRQGGRQVLLKFAQRTRQKTG